MINTRRNTEPQPLRHTGTVRIETARLVLRPLRTGDAAQMFHNWASDPEVSRYLLWNAHADIEASEKFVNFCVSQYGKPEYYEWGIVFKQDSSLIGTCGAIGVSDTHFHCELGYCIGRKYWNKGIVTEAVSAIIHHMFANVGLYRVFARHDTNNPASGRVMEKCGMVREGVMRGALYDKPRGFYDLAYYAVLRDDHERAMYGAN